MVLISHHSLHFYILFYLLTGICYAFIFISSRLIFQPATLLLLICEFATLFPWLPFPNTSFCETPSHFSKMQLKYPLLGDVFIQHFSQANYFSFVLPQIIIDSTLLQSLLCMAMPPTESELFGEHFSVPQDKHCSWKTVTIRYNIFVFLKKPCLSISVNLSSDSKWCLA